RQVRPDVRLRRRAANRVAVRATVGEEETETLAGSRRRERRALGAQPAVEARARLGDDDQLHVRVLDTAELRARAEVRSRPAGVEQHAVRAAGDQVDLAIQL